MKTIQEQRILEVLNFDKKQNPSSLNDVLKSDIIKTLSNFFVIKEEDALIKIDVMDDGNYSIKMVAKASTLKPLNFLR